ncbi:hypothetical protein Pelo_14295 [Pelomyxa schiedti]|nr:hypothetical protein Pelo_14295 [Pelomyxa schiedti]
MIPLRWDSLIETVLVEGEITPDVPKNYSCTPKSDPYTLLRKPCDVILTSEIPGYKLSLYGLQIPWLFSFQLERRPCLDCSILFWLTESAGGADLSGKCEFIAVTVTNLAYPPDVSGVVIYSDLVLHAIAMSLLFQRSMKTIPQATWKKNLWDCLRMKNLNQRGTLGQQISSIPRRAHKKAGYKRVQWYQVIPAIVPSAEWCSWISTISLVFSRVDSHPAIVNERVSIFPIGVLNWCFLCLFNTDDGAQRNAKCSSLLGSMERACTNAVEVPLDLVRKLQDAVRGRWLASDAAMALTSLLSLGTDPVAGRGAAVACVLLWEHSGCKARPDVNRLNGGYTPLYFACKKGHLAVVDALLTKGNSDANKASDGGMPLYIACYHGNTSIVQLLLTKAADLNITWKERTVLHTACEKGFVDIVEHLIRTTPMDVNTPVCGTSLTPVLLTGAKGHIEVVEKLLCAVKAFFESSTTGENAQEVAIKEHLDVKPMALLDTGYPELNEREENHIKEILSNEVLQARVDKSVEMQDSTSKWLPTLELCRDSAKNAIACSHEKAEARCTSTKKALTKHAELRGQVTSMKTLMKQCDEEMVKAEIDFSKTKKLSNNALEGAKAHTCVLWWLLKEKENVNRELVLAESNLQRLLQAASNKSLQGLAKEDVANLLLPEMDFLSLCSPLQGDHSDEDSARIAIERSWEEELKHSFLRNKIDGEAFEQLADEDLQQLGLHNLLHRKAVCHIIENVHTLGSLHFPNPSASSSNSKFTAASVATLWSADQVINWLKCEGFTDLLAETIARFTKVTVDDSRRKWPDPPSENIIKVTWEDLHDIHWLLQLKSMVSHCKAARLYTALSAIQLIISREALKSHQSLVEESGLAESKLSQEQKELATAMGVSRAERERICMRAEFAVNWCDLQVLEFMLEFDGCAMMMMIFLWQMHTLASILKGTFLALPNIVAIDEECIAVIYGRYSSCAIPGASKRCENAFENSADSSSVRENA